MTDQAKDKVPTQDEIIADARKALKNKFHNKALKLAKGIKDTEVQAAIIAAAKMLQSDAKEAAKDKPKPGTKKAGRVKGTAAKAKPRVKGKTAEDVVDAYDDLLDVLADVETGERNKNKPYRFYFFHRRQIENLKRNFQKGMRTGNRRA